MAPSGRFLMFEDEEDVADWDEPVLEVELPITIAMMFDATQRAWFGFQDYCEMVFTEAKKLNEMIEMDGDQRKMDDAFLNIVESLDIEEE